MGPVEVVLVNHGSRRRDFNRLMERLAAELSKRLGVRVSVGYNEYAEPNWRDLVKSAEGKVVVALAFLGSGNHVYRDILGDLGVEPGVWAQSRYGKWVYVTPPLGDSPLVLSALLARVRAALEPVPTPQLGPEEIDNESMRRVAERLGLDLSNWKDRLRARGAYAAGNLDVAQKLLISDDLLDAARESFAAEVPVVVDVKMVAAGLRYGRVYVAVEAPVEPRPTRAAAGVEYWLRELRHGALVVGNAPTALDAARRSDAELAFVVATPPGFTNAAEAKERILKLGVPAAVLPGTLGGTGIAVAIFNELARLAHGG